MSEGYWRGRSHLAYYRVVEGLLRRIPPQHRWSILDVGCADTPVAAWGDFDRRMTVDLRTNPQLVGVRSYVADFLEWEVPARERPTREEPVDVVTCLQTLEHLEDGVVERFAWKLQDTGTWVIVSLPYLWNRAWTKTHHQDPIDLAKFFRIMGGSVGLVHFELVEDNSLVRLVAAFGPRPLDPP
jgi:2-polyprenyl-3-methyl-5-hydroxy-6-metoxy-1,4-benzoquinol methylase